MHIYDVVERIVDYNNEDDDGNPIIYYTIKNERGEEVQIDSELCEEI
jgi:hypothetical protein